MGGLSVAGFTAKGCSVKPLAGRFEFTAAEIADVLRVSSRAVRTRATREEWLFSESTVRGGLQKHYPMRGMPEDVALAIAGRQRREQEEAKATAQAADTSLQARIKAQWDYWARAKGWQKKEAEGRHDALLEVERLQRETGASLTESRKRTAALALESGIAGRSVRNLVRLSNTVEGIPREHWLAFLLPEAKGCPSETAIHPVAFAVFKKDWLRNEQPDIASCYRRVQRLAQVHPEWLPLPSIWTFQRRLQDEVPHATRVYMREGEEALRKLGPQIRRDRSGLSALEVVNSDGHTVDVAVKYPDGTVGRPTILGWQDIYSSKLLSYRIGKSETAELVRLSFCDMVEKYGIPGHAHLDNGRAYASKTNTGGVPTRYRYKVKETDQLGVIARVGVQVHWVEPRNGKAKPIERVWRDVASDIVKRQEFEGAYLGKSPTDKPANYGKSVVPWDVFVRVFADGVAEFNARTERRSEVADGRSFDEVFAESYAASTVRKATKQQLALLLLASEVRRINPEGGFVTLAGNRYWDEALCDHVGKHVELRFDPEKLHDAVHVFGLDGTYFCKARCTAAIGWGSTEDLQEARKLERAWRKKQKECAKAERERGDFKPLDMPRLPEAECPSPAAVAMVHTKRDRRAEEERKEMAALDAKLLERERAANVVAIAKAEAEKQEAEEAEAKFNAMWSRQPRQL